MAKVYWIKGRCANLFESAVAKSDAILNMPEMARLLAPEKSLAIKINMTELGYSHYLSPVVVATLFEKLRDMSVKAVVTDSLSLFKGARASGYDWMNTALVQGFSNGETFDNQLMLADGYTGQEGKFYTAEGERLGGVELGSLFIDTGNILVLSHVTAHPLLGMSGAVANLGLGFLTLQGKLRVHECLDMTLDLERCDGCGVCSRYCPTKAVARQNGRVVFDERVCNSCLGCLLTCPQGAFSVKPEGVAAFTESVAEAAACARQNLRTGAFYVNFLHAVTPQCVDSPFSDVPFLPDLGMLASDDPVALDWATYQMSIRSPGLPGSIAQDLEVLAKGDDKFRAVTGRIPVPLLEAAESLNLGNREAQLLIGA
jgi:uncharacterized Fe-S center protein